MTYQNDVSHYLTWNPVIGQGLHSSVSGNCDWVRKGGHGAGSLVSQRGSTKKVTVSAHWNVGSRSDMSQDVKLKQTVCGR